MTTHFQKIKIGDIVRLAESVPEDFFAEYRQLEFEVRDIYEKRCVVRIIGGANPERYLMSDKEHFEISEKRLTDEP